MWTLETEKEKVETTFTQRYCFSGSPENNYEEDFHASGSDKASKGTNRSLSGSGSEVEEEDMSAGVSEQTLHNTAGNLWRRRSIDSVLQLCCFEPVSLMKVSCLFI